MASAHSLSRRDLVRVAGGTATVVAGAGVVGAQRPSFDGWLSNTSNYDGVHDRRGQSEVTIAVGADGNGGTFAFAPAAVHVDPGTTVRWRWTGDGGAHNVHAVEGAEFRSGDPTAESGVHFTTTLDRTGVVEYQCDPHASLGMRGVLVVGDVSLGGGGDTAPDDADQGESSASTANPYEWPLVVRVVGLGASGFVTITVVVMGYFTYLGMRTDQRGDGSGSTAPESATPDSDDTGETARE